MRTREFSLRSTLRVIAIALAWVTELAGSVLAQPQSASVDDAPGPEAPRCSAPQAGQRISRFAVVMGSNLGTGSELPNLAYADDDAIAAYDLLATDLGFRTILLTDVDANTRSRVGGRYDGVTQPPTTENFRRAIRSAIDAAAFVRSGGGKARVLVWIAAHAGPSGDIYLADRAYARADLRRDLLDVSRAADIDLDIILDSCFPWAVFGRGSNNEALARARAMERWASQLERYPRVGVLLAETAKGEGLEWTELSAGVLSFLVRSALRGAADVDGDGRVTFKEVEAFAQIANNAVEDPRARVQVRAVLPRGSDNRELVDWWEAPGPTVRLRLPGEGVHVRISRPDTEILLETHKGPDADQCAAPNVLYLPKRLGEFHVTVLGVSGRTYGLLTSHADRELSLTADLQPGSPGPRGDSVSEALRRGLFRRAFDASSFGMWKDFGQQNWQQVDAAALASLEREHNVRRRWMWGLLGGAVLTASAGVVSHVVSNSTYDDWKDAVRRDDTAAQQQLKTATRRWDIGATAAFVAAGGLLAAGGVVLLWDARQGVPAADADAGLAVSIGNGLSLSGRF